MDYHSLLPEEYIPSLIHDLYIIDMFKSHRRQEAAYLATRNDTTSGTVWDRVTREVDLSNPKANRNTRDTTRLKQLMLDLKKDPKAPGTIVNV